MIYMMGIDFRKLHKVCINSWAIPNNLYDDDYTCFWYCIAVECFQFFMQQPTFGEHMSYAPTEELIKLRDTSALRSNHVSGGEINRFVN